MKGLDLSRLKKVASDDKTTTFQHEMGHQIKIVHSMLSPKMLKEVQGINMARGGEIAADEDAPHIKGVHKSFLAKNDAGMSESGIRQRQGRSEEAVGKHKEVLSEMRAMPKPELYAKGGETGVNKETTKKGVSEAGAKLNPAFSVGGKKWDTENAKDTHRKTLGELQSMPKPQLYADGSGDVQPDPQPNASPDSGATPQGPVVINVNGGQGQQPAQNQNWQGSSGVASPSGDTGAAPTPPAPPAPAVPDQSQAPQQVDNTPPAPAQPAPPPVPPTAGQVLTQPVSSDIALAHLNDQTAKLRNDFNTGQITPKTYQDLFADKSTLGKIGTMFAMMVGGGGAGLAHQQNALLGMMDKQIDRDLDAQKQTKSNQYNALSLAEKHYQDEIQAHYTQQQGAQTEASTRLTNVNTKTAASNLSKTLLENAVYQEQIRRLGLLPQNTPAAQKGQAALSVMGNAINAQQAQRNQQTANQIAANGQQVQSQGPGQAPPIDDHILSPDAEQKYQQLLYDPSKTPAQKQAIQDAYLSAVQTDKALDQVNSLYPQLMQKRTLGGYLANKVNPNILGGITAAGAEALAAGATGGGSLLGAVPIALGAGAAGAGAGHMIKQGLTAAGGHQEVEYQNAKDALTTIIGGALGPNSHLTPTEIGGIAEQYIPTYSDNDESAADKLEKLKTKIKTLAKTGALKSAGMTNE